MMDAVHAGADFPRRWMRSACKRQRCCSSCAGSKSRATTLGNAIEPGTTDTPEASMLPCGSSSRYQDVSSLKCCLPRASCTHAEGIDKELTSGHPVLVYWPVVSPLRSHTTVTGQTSLQVLLVLLQLSGDMIGRTAHSSNMIDTGGTVRHA